MSRALRAPKGSGPRLLRPSAFPEQGDDYDVFVRVGQLRQSEVSGVSATAPMSEGLSHAAVWLPPETRRAGSLDQDLEGRLEKLGRKMERKLAQARNDEQAERVLIVDTWLTSRLSTVGPEQVERLRRKVVEMHENVAALLLVHREWMRPLGRYGYRMRPLLPTTRAELPEVLIAGLARIDRAP